MNSKKPVFSNFFFRKKFTVLLSINILGYKTVHFLKFYHNKNHRNLSYWQMQKSMKDLRIPYLFCRWFRVSRGPEKLWITLQNISTEDTVYLGFQLFPLSNNIVIQRLPRRKWTYFVDYSLLEYTFRQLNHFCCGQNFWIEERNFWIRAQLREINICLGNGCKVSQIKYYLGFLHSKKVSFQIKLKLSISQFYFSLCVQNLEKMISLRWLGICLKRNCRAAKKLLGVLGYYLCEQKKIWNGISSNYVQLK